METGFLSQFAPLGKRWRRLTVNLVLSLFNFNFVQRALVLEDYPCAGTVGAGVCYIVGKRVQELWEKKIKKGKIIIIIN